MCQLARSQPAVQRIERGRLELFSVERKNHISLSRRGPNLLSVTRNYDSDQPVTCVDRSKKSNGRIVFQCFDIENTQCSSSP